MTGGSGTCVFVNGLRHKLSHLSSLHVLLEYFSHSLLSLLLRELQLEHATKLHMHPAGNAGFSNPNLLPLIACRVVLSDVASLLVDRTRQGRLLLENAVWSRRCSDSISFTIFSTSDLETPYKRCTNMAPKPLVGISAGMLRFFILLLLHLLIFQLAPSGRHCAKGKQNEAAGRIVARTAAAHLGRTSPAGNSTSSPSWNL